MTPTLNIDIEDISFSSSSTRAPLPEAEVSRNLASRTGAAAQANFTTLTFTSSSLELETRNPTLISGISEEIDSADVATLPTYEELLSAVTIDSDPYASLTKTKVEEIVAQISSICPLKEGHLQEAYAKSNFFSPEMTQRLDEAAALPENQAKIESYFPSPNTMALPHDQAIAPPFQRGHLSRAHLLAMCLFLEALQEERADFPFSFAEKTGPTTEEEHQKFKDFVFGGLKEMLSTHIGQILFLRILNIRAKILFQKGSSNSHSKKIFSSGILKKKIHVVQLNDNREAVLIPFHTHGVKIFELSLGQTLFHELAHALQKDPSKPLVKIPLTKEKPFLQYYTNTLELFVIAPILKQEPWFCEAGYSLEKNSPQRNSHRWFTIDNLNVFNYLLNKKNYKNVLDILRSDLFLKDLSFAPSQEVRALIFNTVILHPGLVDWLKAHPEETNTLNEQCKLSPFKDFPMATREELLPSLIKETQNFYLPYVLRFLAPHMSKQEFSLFEPLIQGYETTAVYPKLIACLIQQDQGKKWLEEHPLEQATLCLLTKKDQTATAKEIQKALPLNSDFVKKLITQENQEALSHLLTNGEELLADLFLPEETLLPFLQSTSFKNLLSSSKETLYPLFMIALNKILACCSTQGLDSWDLIKTLLQDTSFLSLFSNDSGKPAVFFSLLFKNLREDLFISKTLDCLASAVSHPETRLRLEMDSLPEDLSFLKQVILQNAENTDAQAIWEALFPVQEESSRKRRNTTSSLPPLGSTTKRSKTDLPR